MIGYWETINLAPEGRVVATRISDSNGIRNEQDLKRVGRLWYVPDGSMYVYYEPTHFWKWGRKA